MQRMNKNIPEFCFVKEGAVKISADLHGTHRSLKAVNVIDERLVGTGVTLPLLGKYYITVDRKIFAIKKFSSMTF